ncbi:TetR/AcrR family transcriptional regulator [Rhizobium sp. P32RR-XVIII]|uniref:TetR/AcrR family transcriptional regulator n=1 Tax=Rhizobium sp. P32RR-XVIII TaxID=2726738 RepID=UPI001456B5A1|nr:TetR/AcrR family transcriptional regulator [Rhizobium sp. P32RR-XVIII]NLS02833.1 TetR/AcrR family transcriptional regulator [Rhizobium sp. P32RR-XVIII]
MNSNAELKRPRGRPKCVDSDQRRNDIISGGRDVFIEAGYVNTTVDVIAARCGISKRTFYEFFDGKADLLREILKSRSEFIFFIPAMDERSPIEEMLERTFFLDNGSSTQAADMSDYFLVEVGWEAADYVPELREDFTVAREKLSDWFRRLRQEGRITVIDADAAATMLIGIVFGSLSIDRAGVELEARARKTKSYLRSSLRIFAQGLQV